MAADETAMTPAADTGERVRGQRTRSQERGRRAGERGRRQGAGELAWPGLGGHQDADMHMLAVPGQPPRPWQRMRKVGSDTCLTGVQDVSKRLNDVDAKDGPTGPKATSPSVAAPRCLPFNASNRIKRHVSPFSDYPLGNSDGTCGKTAWCDSADGTDDNLNSDLAQKHLYKIDSSTGTISGLAIRSRDFLPPPGLESKAEIAAKKGGRGTFTSWNWSALVIINRGHDADASE